MDDLGFDTKQAALRARYGADQLPSCGPWSDIIAAQLAHYSVRSYLPDPLPENTLETLVAAAQSAPTSSNLQTWSVVAVTDTERKRQLSAVAANQKHVVQCPLFLAWIADLSRLERLGAALGEKLQTLPYLEMFLSAAVDAALAAQNAVVAAESLGLSVVYIGALRNDPEKVAAVLNLPKGAFGVFGLCVGYADRARRAEVKPRLPQAAVLHREQYDPSHEAAAIAGYDEKMRQFNKDNEMTDTSWTERVVNRTKEIPAMSGRHRLAEALRALGFGLR